MARYQYDEEPTTFRPYTPGHVTISRFWFYLLCILAGIGSAFILMMLIGV